MYLQILITNARDISGPNGIRIMNQPAETPAKNPELWGRLLDLLDTHEVTFHWVKGHAENRYNNRCDELAVAEWKKFR